jgi:hypothetical protein
MEPVAQFAIKLNQLLLRVDPAMSNTMKLFFLWPRMRHDLARRVRDQAPKTFNNAIQIAQIIEASNMPDIPIQPQYSLPTARHSDTNPSPMDIDVQNVQTTTKRQLPDRDTQGRPRCFHCNLYGHIKRHCRKLKYQQHGKTSHINPVHNQNMQVTLADAASLVELSENV